MTRTQTIATSALSEKYQQLLNRLRKRWLIALIMALPGFILIPFILAKFFQIHWLASLLPVVIVGCWSTLLSQIISLTVFMHAQIKHFTDVIIKNDPRNNFLTLFWKNLKRKVIMFSVISGSFLFWIFLLLWQQPEDDGTPRIIEWGDVTGVLFVCFFISALAFKISNLIINHFLKIKFNHDHNNLSSLEDFQEFQSSFKQSSPNEPNEFRSTDKVWDNWDHDPMNPASGEYQSTYQRWNHDA